MGTDRGAFTVLTYHRIGDPQSAPPGIVSCTPPQFDRQMRWLASTGRAVALGELLAARAEGRPTAPGAVHVTFDDAYGDFRDLAWPILQRHGVPVTLFVPTAFPDTQRRFWWDRLFGALRAAPARMLDSPVGPLSLTSDEERVAAYRRLREHVKTLPHDDAMALVERLVTELGDSRDSPAVLGWAALRELAAEGVTLAAHSRSHPLLNRLAPERLHDEIAGSMSDLQEHTGAGAPAFAYPGGGVSAEAERVVAEAGATVAFTTEVGANDSAAAAWLRLRRVNVGRRTGPLPVLRARMALAAATASRPVQRPAHAPGAGTAQRVAYISSRFPKLSETFVLAEVLAVARRGVQVDVHPLQTKREQVMHPEAAPLAASAHYAPLMSVPVASSQVYWLQRDARGYLSALAALGEDEPAVVLGDGGDERGLSHLLREHRAVDVQVRAVRGEAERDAGQPVDDEPGQRRVAGEVAVDVLHAVGLHLPGGVGGARDERECPGEELRAAPGAPQGRGERRQVAARVALQPVDLA